MKEELKDGTVARRGFGDGFYVGSRLFSGPCYKHTDRGFGLLLGNNEEGLAIEK